MKGLPPSSRLIMRELAYGLSIEDVCSQHPELPAGQIEKMIRGKMFQRALEEFQEKVDAELAERMAEDPVRAYLKSKGLSMAKTLVGVAEDGDEGGSARVKAAGDVLDRIGYKKGGEVNVIPIIQVTPSQLAKLQSASCPEDIPDSVTQEDLGFIVDEQSSDKANRE